MTVPAARRPLLVCTLVALAAAIGPLAAGAPVAGAWSDGPCPTASGVTVVVDFQDLGGGVAVRCTDVAVGSGFEALQAAGIDYRSTVRFPGFLCRIAGMPADDACQTTSPTTAYWSYWIAARGTTWCYSSVGALGRRPPEGTVEGWSFYRHLDRSTPPPPVSPPRISPPAWVTGAPRSVQGGACDGSAPTSTTTPTSAPTSTRPAAPSATTVAPRPAGRGGPSTPPAAGQPSATGDPQLGPPDVSAPPSTAPRTPAAGSAAPAEVAGETTVAAGTEDAAPDRSGQATGTAAGADDAVVGQRKGAVDLAPPQSSTSPAGLVAALVLVTALGVTSGVINRRVRRQSRPDP